MDGRKGIDSLAGVVRSVRIGQSVGERLDYRPTANLVRELIRPTYACRSCESEGRKSLAVHLTGGGVVGRPDPEGPGRRATAGRRAGEFFIPNHSNRRPRECSERYRT